ncbi:leucine-rich repeat domain-containing protein [Beduini massiliensis]|uniref:leucine-rich repeat domain-containing protein n=1 Tax=Beduini massiliensis TaxID=1585974 RepID=UPI00069462AC|nr:leucine-rich repeat domain-containing protein [Beduini massiliensis]
MEEFSISNGNLSKYYGTDANIVIPESVTSIQDFAFYGCENLETVVISEHVTSIGTHAFYGCEKLVSIEIPESVTLIGGGAFSCCKRLETITIPESVKSIGKSTFYKCERLKNIYLPDSIQSIDHSAFAFCTNLESIQLPASLLNIGENAFEECVSLKAVMIPESLTTIGKKAFINCVNLKNIIISENLKEVGENAFLTRSTLTFESNDTLFLKPVYFDSNWMLSFRRKEDESYKFINSYLPNLNLTEWKPYAKLILLVNFLETYSRHTGSQKENYEHACREHKIELLEFLISEKRYAPLNQALEIGVITSGDLQPYFDSITDRDQKVKLMEYKNKESQRESLLSNLEDELMNMF